MSLIINALKKVEEKQKTEKNHHPFLKASGKKERYWIDLILIALAAVIVGTIIGTVFIQIHTKEKNNQPTASSGRISPQKITVEGADLKTIKNESIPYTGEDLLLTGIMWDKKSPMAIINEQVLHVGDSIGAGTVTVINEAEVIITIKGQKYILSLD